MLTIIITSLVLYISLGLVLDKYRLLPEAGIWVSFNSGEDIFLGIVCALLLIMVSNIVDYTLFPSCYVCKNRKYWSKLCSVCVFGSGSETAVFATRCKSNCEVNK